MASLRRVMQVLVALARATGKTVSRDDLIEACWEGRVVGEDSITRCMGRLRRLAESSGAFTLDTVPRVGYRLNVAAEPTAAVRDTQVHPPISREVETDTRNALRPSRSWKPSSLFLGVIVTCATLLWAGVWSFWPRPAVVSPAPPGPPSSVAVLPFANMSGDPAKEYFSDGFSEELLDDLSGNPGIRVAARTSAFAFRNKNEDVATIARTLRVRDIVEGSVRELGNRVRITAELIDGASGYRIWSAKYDRGIADILTVQEEVSRTIAAELTHRLAPRPHTYPRKKIAPDTYRRYLTARRLLNDWTPEGVRNALPLLQQVVKEQPDFSEGFSALALAMQFDYRQNNFRQADSKEFANADEFARKALALDPHNLEALDEREGHALDTWNWNAAASIIRDLNAVNPDDYHVLDARRRYYFDLGFPDQSLALARRIDLLNPNLKAARIRVLINLTYQGANAEAIVWAHTLLAHEPTWTDALDNLCEAYALSGRKQKAREIEEQIDRLEAREDANYCDFLVDLAFGDLTAARKIVASVEAEYPDRFPSAAAIAEYYVFLRDYDKANDWFEQGYAQRDINVLYDAYWPGASDYRQSPRWRALTQQPAFREWQAEHDRIAAALAAHKDPLQ